MILFPNAKINIGLNIIRRRPDGYHDLETVMIPVPWHDILEIVPGHTDSDTLTLSGRPVDCPPEKNLVMKAVKALRNEVDFGPVDICLEKIIPDGAGLGGGSADAAFTLKGINQLFELGLDNSRLARIAASLGADCPFFIYNRPQLCTGTGTDLHPFDISLPAPLWIAIVKPDESVSTAEAYRGVRPATPAAPLAETLTQLPLSQWQGIVKNDFETSVFPTH
ncbi:MAG: 4-(cytidine 5'-diphospho)-2-C-methyl-D-erythritol kinase, partial [Muribaculaceae bacterium]|nr:4-(cytidine 5'-diphospho)-2-C-methyl-D-erythritol kinase [Muribaculaceae bacterium]